MGSTHKSLSDDLEYMSFWNLSRHVVPQTIDGLFWTTGYFLPESVIGNVFSNSQKTPFQWLISNLCTLKFKSTMKTKQLTFYCQEVWPTYPLIGKHWPKEGTFDPCIFRNLYFCQAGDKLLELPYIQAFLILRTCPPLIKSCASAQILLANSTASQTFLSCPQDSLEDVPPVFSQPLPAYHQTHSLPLPPPDCSPLSLCLILSAVLVPMCRSYLPLCNRLPLCLPGPKTLPATLITLLALPQSLRLFLLIILYPLQHSHHPPTTLGLGCYVLPEGHMIVQDCAGNSHHVTTLSHVARHHHVRTGLTVMSAPLWLLL
ncbi:uncharacterized protein LOC134472437 [Cavia porcellus]|uniref:uncharacterized protein LOC134472437 n=1 Tax=Cavia porcellus TaxID=10141 RepID=UPI002FE26193